MNEYKIAIFRSGHSIAEFDADPDAVVEIMRSMHAASRTIVNQQSTAPDISKANTPSRKNNTLRKCRACEKVGHTAKTCARRKRDLPSVKKRAGRGTPCSDCGSPSRHKKGCSKAGIASKNAGSSKMEGNDAWKALGETIGKRQGAISQMAFGRVKISQQHNIPEQTIATNMDLALAEIERAFGADTYEDYLKL